jgi:hypothetical protein
MNLEMLKYSMKHLWSDHKKVVLAFGVILVIAIIL